MTNRITKLKHIILRISKFKSIFCIFSLLIVFCPTDFVQASWKFAVVGDSQGYDNGINSIILSELTSEFIDHSVDCVLFWSLSPP